MTDLRTSPKAATATFAAHPQIRVQSAPHPHAPHAPHPHPHPPPPPPTVQWSPTLPTSLTSVISWLIDEMVALYVSPQSVLLEINCGTGPLIPTLGAQCKQFYGCDPNPKHVQEAQQRTKLFSFPCSIVALDMCRHSPRDRAGLPAAASVDTILCCNDMHRFFGDKNKLVTTLHNVAYLLKPEGVFTGYTVDSNTIWNRGQKKDALKIHNNKKCASVTSPHYLADLVHKEHPKQPFQAYGTAVHLRFPASSPNPPSPTNTDAPVVHPFIHFPTLVRVARRVGLECMELENVAEMISQYRYAGVGEDSEVGLPSINNAGEQEQAGLYLMFAFRRTRATSTSHRSDDMT